MKIKPLRSLVGSYGRLGRGVVSDIDKSTAENLIKRGLAVPVKGGAAAKADANPSKKPRSGGRTGKAKQSSSSQAGQARASSRSK